MPPKRRAREPEASKAAPKSVKNAKRVATATEASSSSSSSSSSDSDDETTKKSTTALQDRRTQTFNRNASRYLHLALFFSTVVVPTPSNHNQHLSLTGVSVQLVVFVKTQVPASLILAPPSSSTASSSAAASPAGSKRVTTVSAVTTRRSISKPAQQEQQQSGVPQQGSIGLLSGAAEALDEVAFTMVDFVHQLVLSLGGTLAGPPIIAQSGSRHSFADSAIASHHDGDANDGRHGTGRRLLVVLAAHLVHSVEAANAVHHFVETATAKRSSSVGDAFGAADAAVAAMKAQPVGGKRGGKQQQQQQSKSKISASAAAVQRKNHFPDTPPVVIPNPELKKLREGWFNIKARRLDLVSGNSVSFGVEVRKARVLAVDARLILHIAQQQSVLPDYVLSNILRSSCPETESSEEWLLPAIPSFSFSSSSFSLSDSPSAAAAASSQTGGNSVALLSAIGQRSADRASTLYQRYILHDPLFLAGCAIAACRSAADEDGDGNRPDDAEPADDDNIAPATLKQVGKHFGAAVWSERFSSAKEFAGRVNEQFGTLVKKQRPVGDDGGGGVEFGDVEPRAYLICSNAEHEKVLLCKRKDGDEDETNAEQDMHRARVGSVVCEVALTAWLQACVQCGRRLPTAR